ncbi:hypothetical protein E2C01_055647 [Portunus trituberculatus]|uniref:Uncharacterized protein n=1 Tax=Portunus trituberculatus TaxID=210409 RepID=A0A5B7GVC4_PORTR|nr:hypothetical protein [Portunus trituberculatus]
MLLTQKTLHYITICHINNNINEDKDDNKGSGRDVDGNDKGSGGTKAPPQPAYTAAITSTQTRITKHAADATQY